MRMHMMNKGGHSCFFCAWIFFPFQMSAWTQEMAEIERKRNTTRMKDKICYPSRPRTSNVIDLDEKTLPDNSHFMKRVDLRQLIVMAS